MSNYTKSTNFATKDSLSSGNPLKIVKGTEINTEFDNIATAVATKADLNSPTLVTPNLGTPSAAVLTNATGLPLTTGVTGILPVANGGTGVTTSTGTGSTVLSTNPVLTTPNLGTPSAATLTNATGLPLSTGVTGTLATTNGGTGLTSFTSGGVVYASSTSALTTGSALTFNGANLSVVGTYNINQTNLFEINNGQSGATKFASGVSLTSDSGGNYTSAFYLASGSDTRYNLMSGSPTDVRFYSANSEQMRLTSTGLGIGTSSPSEKLHIYGATSAYEIIQANGASGFAGLQFKNSATSGKTFELGVGGNSTSAGFSNSFYIFDVTASATRLTLDSSGNLGLGVTPSAWGSGWVAFENKGGSVAANTTSQLRFIHNAYFNGTNWIYKNSGIAPTRYELDTGAHYWFTAPSGTAGNAITFTQAMTLDAGGNLGVGATSPGYRLDAQIGAPTNGIIASFQNTNSTSKTGAQIGFTQAGVDSWAMGMVSGTSGDFAFWNGRSSGGAGTERARIDSSGNLLVGTTSNSPAGTQSQFVNQWSGGSKWGISLNQTVSSATAYTHINFSTNGTTVGNINANNTSTTYATSSDYRLKDNQQPLTGSGAFIDALQPKTWEWKADGSKGVGFIAHEVQEVSPNSVVGEKDAVDEDGKPKYQAMEYGSAEFIANIIAELQSLRARVAALEAKG